MTARILPFVRAEHARVMAVPSGAVPRPLHRDTVAATHRSVRRVGGGRNLAGGAHYRKAWGSHLKTLVRGTNPPASPVRRPASVSPMAGRTAPTTAPLGTWSVVGAQIGPAGVPLPRNTRPGWNGGDAA